MSDNISGSNNNNNNNNNDDDTIHLENEVYVNLLLKYLSVCQEGRIKPNTSNSAGTTESTVRDSIDNLVTIKAIQIRLNYIFSVDVTKVPAVKAKKKNTEY